LGAGKFKTPGRNQIGKGGVRVPYPILEAAGIVFCGNFRETLYGGVYFDKKREEGGGSS